MAIHKPKPKPQKYHSRILNLLLMAGLLWLSFHLSLSGDLPPAGKMFTAYISWGVMIYLLMGFFFAARPSKSVALLGAVASIGAVLGNLDPASFASMGGEMPVFLVIVMFVSLFSYSLGILAGWMLESLLKALWRFNMPREAL